MTIAPMSFPSVTSVSMASPESLQVALLGAGAVLVLAGAPAWSLVPVGGLLFWGLDDQGSRSAARRVCGKGMTLIALSFVVAVAMPVFLPAAVDLLVVAGILGAALAAVMLSAPSARSVLRLRRPRPSDLAWFAGAFAAASVAGLAVPYTPGRLTDLELAAIAGLVVLVPALHELLFRGLLMDAIGDSARGVLLVAAAQGFATAPLFGWAGLVAGALLGLAFGFIRSKGDWQASLFAHWGVTLGLAISVLMVSEVIR